MNTFLNTANFIIQDMENEGFEKDEIISFLAHKMVESTSMQNTSYMATGGGVDDISLTIRVKKSDLINMFGGEEYMENVLSSDTSFKNFTNDIEKDLTKWFTGNGGDEWVNELVESGRYDYIMATGGNVSGDDCEYCVVMSGGSVGEFKGMYDRAGNKLVATFDMKDCQQKAKEYAKRMNAGLSPGEKKYYRLKYIAKKYNPKQFTMVERKATGGNIESGAAHLYITLSDGNIKVYHGDDRKTLLLEKNQVREGSWNKMWECLRGL